MERIQLNEHISFSRFSQGFWRLNEWDLTEQALLTFIEDLIELGITTFDHADIYGDYSCEQLFGNALQLKPQLRNKIELVTKCGIKLLSDKYPERKVKHYDTSYNHIIHSVEKSLQNFGTDYIDLVLIHRPDPFMNAEETARAFHDLRKAGKVREFGVSNFTPVQFEMLAKFYDGKLVTNQIEISPYCLEHFDNGNIEFLQKEGIHPMAWSPLAGGQLFSPSNEKAFRIQTKLNEIANRKNAHAEQIAYAWLLHHPVKIMPIIGSGKLDRIKRAVDSLSIDINLEEWFEILEARRGTRIS